MSHVQQSKREASSVHLPVYVAGVGRYLPTKCQSNEELIEACGKRDQWNPQKLEAVLGIKERRICDPDHPEQSATWMGARAAEEACERAGIKPSDVDLILNASGTPERVLPDNGPSIQV